VVSRPARVRLVAHALDEAAAARHRRLDEGVGSAAADNEVRSALSVKINDALYKQVDLTSALQSKLPKQAKGAAPGIATTIQNGSARAIDAFLDVAGADRVEDINRTAHSALVRVLEDKPLGPLDTNSSGDVVLNLGPMVKQVADRLGVSDRLAANVPEGSGQIVVLKDTQITTAQRAVKVLKAVSLFLVILVFALYALAIYLARGRRRVLLEGSGDRSSSAACSCSSPRGSSATR
jgi:hypothetical protein